jgi:integrase
MNELTNTRWKSPLATFKRAAKRAGLIYDDGIFRIHDLRHAFCTRAAERNIPIQTITTLARHKDPRSTMRYIHHSNKYLQSSLAQMDD